MAETIYLLLGSNEGERLRQLKSAIYYLTLHLARGPVLRSSVYETAAWGLEEQPPFLNMAIRMNTVHPPEDVLTAVHQIEQSFGRQRVVKWGQRTLDIDILFYGDRIIDQPELIIPHPQIQQRRFALAPMVEIAPSLMHPVLERTMTELLADCKDPLPVQVFSDPESLTE